jgi:hypothetical protein
MSEDNREVVGRIKVTIYKGGAPDVAFEGHIPTGFMSKLPIFLRRGFRGYVSARRKSVTPVDMSDKGPTVEDMKEPPAPKPTNPDTISLPPQLDKPPAQVEKLIVEEEQANNPIESEEVPNGTDEGAEGIREDDAEQGSKGRPAWQK